METNKLSVILPVYNGAKFVGRSIESVLNSTYKNLELIIVNDCSTDNTLEVIFEYAQKDSRVRVFSNETNQKLPKTLNNGFRYATGDYYTWTSDDNSYHADALEKMARVLDSHPEIGLVYADFRVCTLDGSWIQDVVLDEPDEIKFKNIIGACFLYRKQLAEKIGEYNPDAFLAEDYDFWIRCYKEPNGKFYHIHEILYDYGRHKSSLSSTRRKEISLVTFELMEKNFDFFYSECITQSDKNRFLETLLSLMPTYWKRVRQRCSFYKMDSLYREYSRNNWLRSDIQFLKNNILLNFDCILSKVRSYFFFNLLMSTLLFIVSLYPNKVRVLCL